MLLLENAKDILFKCMQEKLVHLKKVEAVPLWEAGGRVLAEDVTAGEDVPAFNRSPVDGFALLSSDTDSAAFDNPVTLKVIDTVAAGSCSLKKIVSGTAIKIFTGAPLPLEADCIIKKEEVTELKVDSGSVIVINTPVPTGKNIAKKGEDIPRGEFLFKSGKIISSSHLGILATLGFDPVHVFAKPKIGIFSTGNELVDVNTEKKYGQLRASNLYTLAEIIRQAGGIPVNLGVIPDRVDDILEVYNKAYQLELPIVISTGGTASGDFDVVKDAMEKTGSLRLFNKVAIRPGAPVVSSIKENQLLIGLSGNPAGAVVAMFIIIFQIISFLAGSNKQLLQSQGKLTVPVIRNSGLRGFLWGFYEEQKSQLYVTPLENQFCGAIKNYANSNCLIEIEEGKVDYSINDIVVIWKLY